MRFALLASAVFGFGLALSISPTSAQEVHGEIADIPKPQTPKGLTAEQATKVASSANIVDSAVGPYRQLNPSDGEHNVHILPTRQFAKQLFGGASPAGPLFYHNGPVMLTANVYAIYWTPPHLQTGKKTALTQFYVNLTAKFLSDYARHSIGTINTQYFQIVNGTASFIQNEGGLAAGVIDTSLFPKSGCNDPAYPGNCITDAQIRAEVQKVRKIKGWPLGLNNIFFVFLPPGEGTCAGTACSGPRQTYCAYHSWIGTGANTVLYANQPFPDLNGCTTGPSPNNDPYADAQTSLISHELSEAITDPTGKGWFGAGGLSAENGDLCVGNPGSNTWDGGKANAWWNGTYYEIQTEYDNHYQTCTSIGP